MSGLLCSGTIRPRTKITISAGTSVTDSNAAAAMAKVLVKASGLNSRPSCASSVKIGRNDTVMISRLKNSAGPTSAAASISTSTRGLSGRGALQMLVGVLDHHDGGVDHRADGDGDAAEAHDVGADARAAFIAANAIRMPTGSMMIATSALRTCSRNTMQTSATMMLSSISVVFSVSIAASIRLERS